MTSDCPSPPWNPPSPCKAKRSTTTSIRLSFVLLTFSQSASKAPTAPSPTPKKSSGNPQISSRPSSAAHTWKATANSETDAVLPMETANFDQLLTFTKPPFAICGSKENACRGCLAGLLMGSMIWDQRLLIQSSKSATTTTEMNSSWPSSTMRTFAMKRAVRVSPRSQPPQEAWVLLIRWQIAECPITLTDWLWAWIWMGNPALYVQWPKWQSVDVWERKVRREYTHVQCGNQEFSKHNVFWIELF